LMRVTQMLKRLWDRLEDATVAALLVAVLVLVVAGVVSRYVLHQSISFTEELTRYLFVWATFLGVAAAARSGAHLGLSIIVDRLTGLSKTIAAVLATVACVAFFGCVAAAGVMVVHLQIRTGQTTSALGAPIWWVGLAIPVGCILAVVRFVEARFGATRGEGELPGS